MSTQHNDGKKPAGDDDDENDDGDEAHEREEEERARARNTDPDTSHRAADSVKRITETQEAIADLMRHIGRPMTDTEIAVRYADWRQHFGKVIPRSSPSGLRTRRSELVERKVVRDSGRREVLPSGRRAILWEIVEWPDADAMLRAREAKP